MQRFRAPKFFAMLVAAASWPFLAQPHTESSAGEPPSAESRELGLELGASGQLERAYALLGPWAKAHPEDLEAVIAAAFCALDLERFGEAEALLHDLPIAVPRVRLLRGRLLLASARFEEVVTVLSPALATVHEAMEIDVRKLMASALLELGRSSEAVGLLERYGSGVPTALLLSRALFENGSPERARSVLEPLARQLAAASPQAAPADRGLVTAVSAQYGRVLHALGDSEAAIPFLELAATADPENRIAWHTLGHALAAAGRRPEALDALARAQRLLETRP